MRKRDDPWHLFFLGLVMAPLFVAAWLAGIVEFWRWNGGSSLAGSTLLDTVHAGYYADLSLLYAAQWGG